MSRLATVKQRGLVMFSRIDLPQKALAWEDDAWQVGLSCNDPAFLAQRHDAPSCPAAQNLRRPCPVWPTPTPPPGAVDRGLSRVCTLGPP